MSHDFAALRVGESLISAVAPPFLGVLLRRERIDHVRELSYGEGGEPARVLDVYRPRDRDRVAPIVLYVHGGGFRALSKDTHQHMGLRFASKGFLTLAVNYRLAPRHWFPAALEDLSAACIWATRHAAALGGDPRRLTLAGESAGANLALATAIATCQRRDEPWARVLFDNGVMPQAVIPACGILQVTDIGRLTAERRVSARSMWRTREMAAAYLGAAVGEDAALADPLLVLER